jgi:cytochrome c oxidase subunit 3
MMLWVNTGILVLASIALQFAKNAAAAGNDARTRMAFYLGGLLTMGFVTGQLLVWQMLSHTAHIVSSNPASSFFYLITAAHGLHILGGLVAWGMTDEYGRRI